MNLHDWKDDEYQYCCDLVHLGGSDRVSVDNIPSYLRTQIASARRDKRRDVVAALQTLLDSVEPQRACAMFERFSIELHFGDAESGSQPGQDASEDIAELRKLPYIAEQLDVLDPDEVRAELKETGGWDTEELADDDENLSRVLWIACSSIREESRS